MSDLKDRACKARQNLAEEVKSFESASEQLANQEIEIDSYEVAERVQIDDISLDSSYFCADVEMPQVKHLIGALDEYWKILDEVLVENDKLKRELKEQSEAPSTESPGDSGSVFFKEYYDELLQACAENDEARIAEHVHDGPELLRSAEIPCRIPQPQVTIADTQTIKDLQSEVEYTKALLQIIGDKFGISATSHCSMLSTAKLLEKESIDDMIS